MESQIKSKQKKSADVQGAFERAWKFSTKPNNMIEKQIANHKWKMVVIGEHEASSIAQDIEKFAIAFKGDCFVFETQKAHDEFFQEAHPIHASKISISTLGVIEHDKFANKLDPIFSRVDCVVCIGHPQSKILGEIRKAANKIYTDPINLDAIIAEKNRMSPAIPKVQKQRTRVIGG